MKVTSRGSVRFVRNGNLYQVTGKTAFMNGRYGTIRAGDSGPYLATDRTFDSDGDAVMNISPGDCFDVVISRTGTDEFVTRPYQYVGKKSDENFLLD